MRHDHRVALGPLGPHDRRQPGKAAAHPAVGLALFAFYHYNPMPMVLEDGEWVARQNDQINHRV